MATLIVRGNGAPGVARTNVLVGMSSTLSLGSVWMSRLSARDGFGGGLDRALLAGAIVVTVLVLGTYVMLFVNRRRARRLAVTELWLSPYGAAYACADGRFEVPWSAVRRIAFEGTGIAGPDVLRVDADWPGPVRRRWAPGPLRIALTGTDRAAVARAAYGATGGLVRL